MPFKVGDQVILNPPGSRPTFDWGHTKRGDVGTITYVADHGTITVNFPNHHNWRGVESDFEPPIADCGRSILDLVAELKGVSNGI